MYTVVCLVCFVLFGAMKYDYLQLLIQEEAINETVHFFPEWFLKDVADLG